MSPVKSSLSIASSSNSIPKLIIRQADPTTIISNDNNIDITGSDTSTLYKYAFFILGLFLGVAIILRILWNRRLRDRIAKARRSVAFQNGSPSSSSRNDNFIGPITELESIERRRRREERRMRRMTEEEGYGLPKYNKEIIEGEQVLDSTELVEENEEYYERNVIVQVPQEVHVRMGLRETISTC